MFKGVKKNSKPLMQAKTETLKPNPKPKALRTPAPFKSLFFGVFYLIWKEEAPQKEDAYMGSSLN